MKVWALSRTLLNIHGQQTYSEWSVKLKVCLIIWDSPSFSSLYKLLYTPGTHLSLNSDLLWHTHGSFHLCSSNFISVFVLVVGMGFHKIWCCSWSNEWKSRQLCIYHLIFSELQSPFQTARDLTRSRTAALWEGKNRVWRTGGQFWTQWDVTEIHYTLNHSSLKWTSGC